MHDIFEKQYFINSYNCDGNFKVKLVSIVDFLQDIAMWHSDALDCNYNTMAEIGYAWILYRWKIRMYKTPLLGDCITVKTWSSGFDKKYAYRSFRLYDDTGSVIGEALSIWLILDINSRSLCSIPDIISEKYPIIDDFVFKNDLTANPLSMSDEIIFKDIYTTRHHDIDYNNHVNNARYIELFLDTIPKSVQDNKSFYDLEVLYKKECAINTDLDCICFSVPPSNEVSSDHQTFIGVIKQTEIENNRHGNSILKLTFKS